MHAIKEGLRYLSGFGAELATEALPGALPHGQNSPQKVAYGLYAEQISGTAFTAPRHQNRRSWLYRIRPGAMHGTFRAIDNGLLRSAPFDSSKARRELGYAPRPIGAALADAVGALRASVAARRGR